MRPIIEIPAEGQADPMVIITPRPFTVEEYHRMIAGGILAEDERVELIEGEILAIAAKSLQHVAGVRRVYRCLNRHLDKRAFTATQDPIQIGDSSEPEPDVIVARLSKTEYEDHHPTPSELLLVVEVAETSVTHDRTRKLSLYARAGIIQYCILNLRDSELEDYRDPSLQGYRHKQTYTAKQSFSLVAFPDVKIKVTDLLPRRI